MCCVLRTTASDLIDFQSSWVYVGPPVVHVLTRCQTGVKKNTAGTCVLMLQIVSSENI